MSAVDLKYLGLVLSVAAAVAFRFFSDFSFATVEHQAALANIAVSSQNLARLILNTLSYQLQRDWFNLTPQAGPEIIGVVVAFGVAYVLLRRAMAPTPAATTLMVVAPFVGIATTVVASTWIVLAARAV